jgi:hypothetical protein
MKKYCFVVIAVICSINFARGQASWIDYNIDNRVSVKIPSQPKKIDEFNVMSSDMSGSVYVIGAVDLAISDGTDSAKLVTLAPTAEYATMMRTKLIESMPGFEMGEIKTGLWKQHNAYYLNGIYTRTKGKVYMFLFIIGSKMYNLAVITPENSGGQAKDDFFASATLH